jgi:hypothetical protein
MDPAGVTVAIVLAFFSDEYARYSFEVRSHPLPGAVLGGLVL